jgi:hypothetical protein
MREALVTNVIKLRHDADPDNLAARDVRAQSSPIHATTPTTDDVMRDYDSTTPLFVNEKLASDGLDSLFGQALLHLARRCCHRNMPQLVARI